MITLRDYQDPFFHDIIKGLEKYDKLCAYLPTGGGKSVVIGKLATTLPGRTLILTHRVEILLQNSQWLKQGEAGALMSGFDTLRYDNKIVIAMVQTLDARIKNYGIDYIGKFNNIILDEAHILIYEKVFKKYDYQKLIGFTGSPIVYGKNLTFEIDGVEYTQPYCLDQMFDHLVVGPDVPDLININRLTPDYTITLKLPDFDKLRESKSNPDGYTSKSLNEVYENTVSLDILDKALNQYANGKKTIIFNATNKVSKFVFDHLKQKGCNVKLYDTSSNTEINPATGKKWKRDEIVEWFRNERDAILVNTNVFTTGFDVDDIEVVVVNRATKSLALWIQMVGRGSRVTEKIYKDKFTVIDLGQNIHEHGLWSKRRDWQDLFKSPPPRLKNKRDLLSTWECDWCGSLNIVGDLICNYCNVEKTIASKETKTKKLKDGELEIIQDMDPPRGNQIVSYCERNDKDTGFAFKLLRNKILELFIHYQISDDFYRRRKKDSHNSSGGIRKGFDSRIEEIFRPCYFAIVSKKNKLKGKKRRKFDTELERIIKAVDKQMNYE